MVVETPAVTGLARVGGWSVLLSLLLLGARVDAQPTDALLRLGIQLRHQGRDEEALAVFSRAYSERPDARTAAQLGLAHQSLGHWLDAERLLVEALATTDAWVQRNRASLDAARVAASRRLGSLEVRGETVGAEVLVDGRSVGRLPLAAPVRVAAGVLTVEARLEGHLPVSRRVLIEPGEAARESIPALLPVRARAADAQDAAVAPAAVTDASADAPEAAVTAPAPSVLDARAVLAPTRLSTAATPARDALAATALTLGGAGIATAVAGFVVRAQIAGRYNRACPPAGPSVCEGLVGEFDAWTIASWVALPLGLTASGLGAWLLATRPAASPARGLASLRCGPSRPAELSCSLRFE